MYIVWNSTRTIGVVTHEAELVQEIATGAFKMRVQDCIVEEFDYEKKIRILEDLAYVSNTLICSDCGLTVSSYRHDSTKRCINCAGPLQRLSERDAGKGACDRNMLLLKKIHQLNKEKQWLCNSIILALEHLKKHSTNIAEVLLRAAITRRKKETVQ